MCVCACVTYILGNHHIALHFRNALFFYRVSLARRLSRRLEGLGRAGPGGLAMGLASTVHPSLLAQIDRSTLL